jgi:hypothetical protein
LLGWWSPGFLGAAAAYDNEVAPQLRNSFPVLIVSFALSGKPPVAEGEVMNEPLLASLPATQRAQPGVTT